MRRHHGCVRGAAGLSEGESARVILASASPRRRELLAALIPGFVVQPSDIPEPFSGDPAGDAVSLALAKAKAITAHAPGAIVIGSDTVVFDDERQYGKPRDASDARAMLAALVGRVHGVATGVAVVSGTGERTAVSVSRVAISALDEQQIDEYVASGRPLDKAGAYAIQDEDVPTVASFHGCYCGVMGLPLWTLRQLLEGAGVSCGDPGETYARCRECPERG